MCQQGESQIVSIRTLFYFRSTPYRGWPNNVCCDAAQICPTPAFEHVCAVCCCVGSPPCVNTACVNIVVLKVSALRWVGACCCLFPVAPACFPCVLFSVVFAFAAVGCSGLVRATKLVNRQRFPTPPGVYSNYSCVYNVLTLFGSTPSLPQVNLVHPPGFL